MPPIGHGHDGQIIDAYPYRANLYRLDMAPKPGELYVVRVQDGSQLREEIRFEDTNAIRTVAPQVRYMRRALHRSVMVALATSGYVVSSRKETLVVDTSTNYSPIQGHLGLYASFTVRVLSFSGIYYLCVDYKLTTQVIKSVAALTSLVTQLSLTPSQRLVVRQPDGWEEGRLLAYEADMVRVALVDDGREIVVPSSSVIPDLSRAQIAQVAAALGVSNQDLERRMKQLSFLTVANAPRARLDACNEFADRIVGLTFPINAGAVSIALDPSPATLRPPDFDLQMDLHEAVVSFDRTDRAKRARDIRKGLVTFGAYDKPVSRLRLVLLTTHNRRTAMQTLVRRMNEGSSRYPGAARVFGGEFTVRHIITCAHVEEYEDALREFVRGDMRREVDVAFVYLPRGDNSHDPNRPYSRVKGLLIREGLVPQMVDERTVLDPEWSDLNLALNVYAKAGHVPWVLDEAMPNVDLFIGLSSSSIKRGGRVERTMGYANVFDAYGRWRFFQGDTAAFAFADRLRHYSDVVKNSLASYRAENGGPLRSVHIHLTKIFSAEERQTLADAVHSVVPDASVTFVWVNPHHSLRLYNLAEADARIGRATYLGGGGGRIYLATTGTNLFQQQGMGTPIPLELTVWTDQEDISSSLHGPLQRFVQKWAIWLITGLVVLPARFLTE